MSDRILYISGRCPHCKKVLLGFHQYPFLKSLFNVVNIDNKPYPEYVKSIPSILIQNQIISGDKVFEYFGKLVEGKMQQDERIKNNNTNSSDMGECRINEDGELEGWCDNNGGVEFSMITEENDDFTKKKYKIQTNFDFLDNQSQSLNNQIKNMEVNDQKIDMQKKEFDNDLEKLQQERGKLLNNQHGPNGMMRIPQ